MVILSHDHDPKLHGDPKFHDRDPGLQWWS